MKSLSSSSSSSPCSTPTPQPPLLFVLTSPSPQRRPTIKASGPPALRFNLITALIRHHINRFTASKCRWPQPPRRLRPRSDPWDFVLRGTPRSGNVGKSWVGVRFFALRHNSNPTESDGDIFHQRKSDGNGNCLAFFFLCHLAHLHLPTPNPASQHASGLSLANSPRLRRFEVLASAVAPPPSICVASTCNLRYARRHLDIIGLLFSFLFLGV